MKRKELSLFPVRSTSLPGPLASTMDFIADPKRLPLWTAHQTVMLNEQGNWIERRMMEDVPLKVSREGTRVDFLWSLSDGVFVSSSISRSERVGFM